MSNPAVDIIIPYFNGIEYLGEAIESVRSQSFKNFRLLIIDDGSKNSLARDLVKSFDDSRLEYCRNKQNIGLPANFEKSKNSIKAEWGVILGHDDRLHPRYLEQMLMAAKKAPSAALIQPQVDIIDRDGLLCYSLPDQFKRLIRVFANLISSPIAKNVGRVKSTRALELMMLGDFLYFPTIMWRTRELANHSFRQDLAVTLDLEIIINIFLSGGELLLVNQYLAEYRRHPGSLSGKPELKLNRMEEEVGTYQELAQILKKKGMKIGYWLAIMHISTRLHILFEIVKCTAKGQYKDSSAYLRLIF